MINCLLKFIKHKTLVIIFYINIEFIFWMFSSDGTPLCSFHCGNKYSLIPFPLWHSIADTSVLHSVIFTKLTSLDIKSRIAWSQEPLPVDVSLLSIPFENQSTFIFILANPILVSQGTNCVVSYETSANEFDYKTIAEPCQSGHGLSSVVPTNAGKRW